MYGMKLTSIYYTLKPIIPRWLQIAMRRNMILLRRKLIEDGWPIDGKSCQTPPGWSGWPENKKFALVLTHDVESLNGVSRCLELMSLERELGFCSSFNFVPHRYPVLPELRNYLTDKGFEVGVHDLKHDGKLYVSKEKFLAHAVHINNYLKDWGSIGFRSGAMHHNLDWLQGLNIKYDASTFDIDPFEPQADGMGTIFPFWYQGTGKGYVELPYTIPQDFTLYVLMKEKNIDLWKQKLDWIVSKGGMVLSITHPDYMNFGCGTTKMDEYPVARFREFLEYIKTRYEGQYWNPLPGSMAEFWDNNYGGGGKGSYDKTVPTIGEVSRKEELYAFTE